MSAEAHQLVSAGLLLNARVDLLRTVAEHGLPYAQEEAIINYILLRALTAGYRITVIDDIGPEGENVLPQSVDLAAINAVRRTTDGDTILFFLRDEKTQNSDQVGWMKFVYGNGCDVVHDYSAMLPAVLEAIVDEAQKFAEAIDDRRPR